MARDDAHVDLERLLAAHALNLAAPAARAAAWPARRRRSRRSRRGRACRRRPARSGPRLRFTAPVKAPRSWPNSSLSSSVSGSAAQLTTTKGPSLRGRELVEHARDQLLAGAALAADEHGGVGGGGLAHLREQPLHRLAVADHASPCGRARRRARAPRCAREQALHLRARVAASSSALVHLGAQHLGREGLGDEVVGALLHRLHRGLDGAEGGDHHHHRLAGPAP